MITRQESEKLTEKIMLSLGDRTFKELKKEADKREISVQELIRAVIVPDWISKK